MTLETNPFAQHAVKPQAAEWLNFGEVKPIGWLYQQIHNDLEHGFVGHLDKLVPALIVDDDIYGKHRLTDDVKGKELGVVTHDTGHIIQYLWWNSETQSNWWDGLVRSALLVAHPEFMQKVDDYVARMLDYQDDDGYMGIYAPDLRFNFSGENGELWAQASLLRVLLGYFEATQKPHVLHAIQRAVSVTRQAYPIGQSNPFVVEESFAGVGHGLVFTDVLDRLYQLTGDYDYLVYAAWLYEAYCAGTVAEADIKFENLMNLDYRFAGHGVHVYEHMRSLVTAVYATNNPQLETALTNYLEKLDRCVTPSGGPIGDEWVEGRDAHATETGYEYCSIHELLDSYCQLLQKSGDLSWADRIEWLLFNAGQGARHPHQPAIAYLNTDNVYSMRGTHHSQPNPAQNRYKFSPTHQDVAVCCVPNAGRIYPYFVRAMWLRTPAGLCAALYGPCVVETAVNQTPIRITQTTAYPFDHHIHIKIELSAPISFEIALRKPGWAQGFRLSAEGVDVQETEKQIKLNKRWQDGDEIEVAWETAVTIHSDPAGYKTISYGPLLYALPLQGREKIVRNYDVSGFHDWHVESAGGQNIEDGCLVEESLRVKKRPFFELSPWSTSPTILASILDQDTQNTRSIELIPFGATSLRQTTFT
jgi:DUF1680 family protein